MELRMFENAFNKLMKYEGGYVDDPLDMGGATNCGISTNFLKSHGIEKNAKDLTISEIKNIYEVYFWRLAKCDQIENDKLAYFLFDSCVNCGQSRAVTFLQIAINSIRKIEVDGIIGTETIMAINSIKDETDISFVLNNAIVAREFFYLEIVRKNDSQRRFIKGWLNRCEDLR